MGTPAQAEIHIEFNEDSEEAIEKVISWIESANSGKLKGKFEGDYDISIDDSSDTDLWLKANSDRSQNLDWQLENLSFFVFDKVKEAKGFDTTVWVMSDGPWWERENE